MSDAEFASSSEPLAGEISRYDRILGCLLGGAVGDALGAPTPDYERYPPW